MEIVTIILKYQSTSKSLLICVILGMTTEAEMSWVTLPWSHEFDGVITKFILGVTMCVGSAAHVGVRRTLILGRK